MTRSRRETICLRVVLGLYAAVLLVAGILWRASGELLIEVFDEWMTFLQDVRASRGFPSASLNRYFEATTFGLMMGSALLAEQFVSHTLGRGWRMSSRWLWRSCILHASVVLSWLTTGIVGFREYLGFQDLVRWIIPVFGVATTKLICAILVLREKRELPNADDVLPRNP